MSKSLCVKKGTRTIVKPTSASSTEVLEAVRQLTADGGELATFVLKTLTIEVPERRMKVTGKLAETPIAIQTEGFVTGTKGGDTMAITEMLVCLGINASEAEVNQRLATFLGTRIVLRDIDNHYED